MLFMKKRIVTVLALLMCILMLLSSCDLEFLRETTEPEDTDETEETEETTEAVPTTEATVIPSETVPPIEGAPDYLDCVPITDYAILFLKMEYDETEIVTGYGDYDVNRDGTSDHIQIEINESAISASVTINGASAFFMVDYFTTAFLIDIDRGDDFIDLFVLDNGPSEDPVAHIFRYDGTSVIHLGDIYGSLRCNRQGQILSNIGYIWYAHPVIVFSWLEVFSGSIIYHKIDPTFYIGQTSAFYREIGEDYGTWLEETATIPAYDAYPYGPAPANIIVPGGTEFTILDVSDFSPGYSPNWYYVRLEDGRTGVYYYMKGD
jgi:hypothetical protein